MEADLDPPADRYGEAWAGIYDEEHSRMEPAAAQLDLLAGLAGEGRALELGVGTGRVALPLAARGVDVQGLDASPSMVARLRAKPGGAEMIVTIGDMADPAVAGTFRLVYAVYNTFFALRSQEQQVACFRKAAGLLAPDGVVLLECFVPDTSLHAGGQSLRTVRLTDDDIHIVATRHDPVTQEIDSNMVWIGDDGTTVRPVRLRYAWPCELDLMAQLAGRELRQRAGGWAGQPFTAASPHHVSVYGRS